MIVGTAPVTDALVELVADVGAGPVGEGSMPTAGDPPFAIVYNLPSGDFWGPGFAAPQVGTALDYQVTIVDISRVGAELFADLVRHAVLDRDAEGTFLTTMSAGGLVVLDRELLAYGGVVHERGVYSIADTYRIHVTQGGSP